MGGPSPVDVFRRVAMGAWSIIHQVFYHMAQLSDFRRVASHNVVDKDTHHLLGGLVDSFHQSLFHRTIWVAESLTRPHQRQVLVDQSILELWASIASDQSWHSSRAHHAVRKHAPDFGCVTLWANLDENAMAETTDVRHAVAVTMLVRRIARSFQVNHHFFPAFEVSRNDWHLWCLGGNLPEADASLASVYI